MRGMHRNSPVTINFFSVADPDYEHGNFFIMNFINDSIITRPQASLFFSLMYQRGRGFSARPSTALLISAVYLCESFL